MAHSEQLAKNFLEILLFVNIQNDTIDIKIHFLYL